MDQLDKAIADLQRKIERWTRQAEEGRIELAALEKAAKLRPNGVRRPPDAETDGDTAFFVQPAPISDDGRRPGRPTGAISDAWQEVLCILWIAGGTYSYTQIHETARDQGKMDVKEVANTRDRVRGFVASGLMSGTPETGFTVTEVAADRFQWKGTKDSAPLDDFADGAGKVEGL